MTAEVLTHPSAGAIADETVRRSVKALTKGRGVSTEDLARAIGMTPSTLYRRLAGKGSSQAFSAGEVALIAAALGIPITDLFSGLGGAVAASETDVQSAQSWPPFETATPGDELARARQRRRRKDSIPWLPMPIIGRARHLHVVAQTA